MLKFVRTLGVAAAAALAVFLAPVAGAGQAPGDKAPSFKGRDFVNTTSVDLQTLQGRVVLLEIFRTW